MTSPTSATSPGTVRLFAVLSDTGKSNTTTVMRVCQVHIKQLDIQSPEILTGEGTLRLGVRLRRRGNPLRAPLGQIPHALGVTDLDLIFSIQYAHSIKGRDVLELVISKRKGPVTEKTVAVAPIVLQNVLQRPFSGVLSMSSHEGSEDTVATLTAAISSLPVDATESLQEGVADSELGVFHEDAVDSEDEGYTSDDRRTQVAASPPNPVTVTPTRPLNIASRIAGLFKGSEQEPAAVDLSEYPTADAVRAMKERNSYANASDSEDETHPSPVEPSAPIPVPVAPTSGPDQASSPEDNVAVRMHRTSSVQGSTFAEVLLSRQFDELLSAEEFPSYIMLVNCAQRRGRKLAEWAQRGSAFWKGHWMATHNAGEAEKAVNFIYKQYQRSMENRTQPFMLVIVGSDSYINEVVKPLVTVWSQKSRDWDPGRVGIIPLGHYVDIAAQLMSSDAVYRSLFFSPAWEALFSSTEPLSEADGANLDSRLQRYINEAKCTYPFHLGEAFITVTKPSLEQKSVPFIKGVELGMVAEMERTRRAHKLDISSEPAEFVQLQLDYWNMTKRDEVQKVSSKMYVNYLAVLRLNAVVAQLLDGAVMPTPHSFALIAKVGKDRKLPFSKERKSEIIKARIEKLVCSCGPDEILFNVSIDGVSYKNVKFVSVSPQWMSHVKIIHVATFCEPPKPQQEQART